MAVSMCGAQEISGKPDGDGDGDSDNGGDGWNHGDS
jgi:hypothetical protein